MRRLSFCTPVNVSLLGLDATRYRVMCHHAVGLKAERSLVNPRHESQLRPAFIDLLHLRKILLPPTASPLHPHHRRLPSLSPTALPREQYKGSATLVLLWLLRSGARPVLQCGGCLISCYQSSVSRSTFTPPSHSIVSPGSSTRHQSLHSVNMSAQALHSLHQKVYGRPNSHPELLTITERNPDDLSQSEALPQT